jgi:cytochrome c biogenesis factor
VAILNDLFGDLYIAMGEGQTRADGQYAFTLRVYRHPMVHLIFFGAGLMALGGVLGLVALARRRTQEVSARAEAPGDPAAMPAE